MIKGNENSLFLTNITSLLFILLSLLDFIFISSHLELKLCCPISTLNSFYSIIDLDLTLFDGSPLSSSFIYETV